jgi:DNA-directed RNA polymerase specialized sigma24 family protein
VNALLRIDLALERMALEAEPGRSYSCAEIAEACNLFVGTVRMIESKALRKCRRLMRKLQLDGQDLNE